MRLSHHWLVAAGEDAVFSRGWVTSGTFAIVPFLETLSRND